MTRSLLYIDTSALAKWYLNESCSEVVESLVQDEGSVATCGLTSVEMRCLLARRRRNREIDHAIEMRVLAAFEEDAQRGFLVQLAFAEPLFAAASRLIASLPDVPLRTLDALHLAIMREHNLARLATADTVMAQAAAQLGIETRLIREEHESQRGP